MIAYIDNEKDVQRAIRELAYAENTALIASMNVLGEVVVTITKKYDSHEAVEALARMARFITSHIDDYSQAPPQEYEYMRDRLYAEDPHLKSESPTDVHILIEALSYGVDEIICLEERNWRIESRLNVKRL